MVKRDEIPSEFFGAESQEKFDQLANLLKILREIPPPGNRTKLDVKVAAENAGVHVTTIYRYLSRLDGRGTVYDLSPKLKGFPKGRSRLHRIQEEIISKYLKAFYLTQERLPMVAVTIKIGDACEDAGFSRPTRAAVIRRLRALPKRVIALKREGPKAAEKHTPRPGQYAVERAWDVWQIDHTLADVIVVDLDGRPIGRVWLTVVIDVATRMVVAFYIGLDPPSIIRVAATLDLAVSCKTDWLTSRGLEYPWPCEGMPVLLHSDRAKEFTSPLLRNAMLNQGVEWFLRPPGRTRYGGHVERLIGTLMGHCRLLPGATYNSPKARGNYDSKGAARLTIDQVEMYFSHQILGVYHHTVHSALGITPMQAWAEKAADRIPVHPEHMEAFRLDILPQIERSVTRQGIKPFNEEYYSARLGEAYIAGLRRVSVKYDPRDLSQIYVKNPQGGYLAVPYRFRREGQPPTLWLVKTARRASSKPGSTKTERAIGRRATEAAELVIAQAAPKSGAAARQLERLMRDRSAAAAFRPSPQPPPSTDDDWGGVFEEGNS